MDKYNQHQCLIIYLSMGGVEWWWKWGVGLGCHPSSKQATCM